MVIWTRWGILGLIIPTALIVIAMIGAEKVAAQRLRAEDRPQVKKAATDEDAEDTSPEQAAEELVAARRRAADRERATVRAEGTGYLIGGLASAAVLWPLGRRMNRVEAAGGWDAPSGPSGAEGGGHTMFFIPLEFWGFIWAVIGLFKFFGSA